MPARVPVLGRLDGRMGDLQTRGNQVAVNGVHRRNAHVPRRGGGGQLWV